MMTAPTRDKYFSPYEAQFLVRQGSDFEAKKPIDALRPADPKKPHRGYPKAKTIMTVPDEVVGIRVTGRGGEYGLVRSGNAEGRIVGQVLPDTEFVGAALAMKSLGQGAGMIGTVSIIDRYIPEAQFVPERLRNLVLNPEHPDRSYGEALASLFWRFDLSQFQALFHAGEKIPASSFETVFGNRIKAEDAVHLNGSWFAFRSEDDAVIAKIMRDERTRVFPIT